MKKEQYDVDVAVKVGLIEAIVLEKLRRWIEYNKSKGKNFRDGKTWTFNSKKEWANELPGISEGKVKRALDKLRAEGYIETGNFNKFGFDRTLWYALTEKGYSILYSEQQIQDSALVTGDQCSGENIEIGLQAGERTIPTTKTSNKPTNNQLIAYANNILFTEDEYNKLLTLAKDKELLFAAISGASSWKIGKCISDDTTSDFKLVDKWLRNLLNASGAAFSLNSYIWKEVLQRLRKPWSNEEWSSIYLREAVREVGFTKMANCDEQFLDKNYKSKVLEIYDKKLKEAINDDIID